MASVCALIAIITFPLLIDELKVFLTVKSPMNNASALVLMGGSRALRLPSVVELYKNGVAPRILLANDGVKGAFSQKHKRNLYLVEWSKEYLLKRDIPENAIVTLGFTKSGSYYDAVNTRAYVLSHSTIESLLVVTSDYHTRRTRWTFETVFADTDIRIGVYPVPTNIHNHLERLYIVMTELTKLYYYKIRYSKVFSDHNLTL